jgi:hypothetical protein
MVWVKKLPLKALMQEKNKILESFLGFYKPT